MKEENLHKNLLPYANTPPDNPICTSINFACFLVSHVTSASPVFLGNVSTTIRMIASLFCVPELCLTFIWYFSLWNWWSSTVRAQFSLDSHLSTFWEGTTLFPLESPTVYLIIRTDISKELARIDPLHKKHQKWLLYSLL